MSARQSFFTIPLRETHFLSDLECLKVLSNKKVALFKVSPLLDFELQDINKCANFLKQNISGTTENVDVVIEQMDQLPYCDSSIQVSIVKETMPYYTSVLLTLAVSEGENSKGVMYLPLLCVIKGLGVSDIVHDLLQKAFGCKIRPCTLDEQQFNWLWGITLFEIIRRNETGGLLLTYQFPSSTSFSINCEIPDEDLKRIWYSFRDPNDLSLSSETVMKFLPGIEAHVYYTYGVDLPLANLVKIQLNQASISAKRDKPLQVNIGKPEVLFSVLSYIQSEI